MERTTRGTRTKKEQQAVKITPKPKFSRQGVDFAELNNGTFFLYQDCLCIKQSGTGQLGVDVEDGASFSNLCGTYVLPVNVEIKWTKK